MPRERDDRQESRSETRLPAPSRDDEARLIVQEHIEDQKALIKKLRKEHASGDLEHKVAVLLNAGEPYSLSKRFCAAQIDVRDEHPGQGSKECQCFFSRCGAQHIVACLKQRLAQHLPQELLVLNQQNGGRTFIGNWVVSKVHRWLILQAS